MSSDSLEILRNTLLMGVLLILVYVLYKRMLRVLGKDEVSKRFQKIEHNLKLEDGEVQILVVLERSCEMEIQVFNTEDDLIRSIDEKNYEAGSHNISLPGDKLAVGRYYYKLVTRNEDLSRYFEV